MTIRLFRGRVVLSAEETAARVHEVNGMTITSLARTIHFRVPFGCVGWLWPTAVLVERDGSTVRLPIRNMTRLLRLGTVSMIPVFILAVRRFAYTEKETTYDNER